jgi:hypothetical protein
MKDDQLSRKIRFIRPTPLMRSILSPPRVNRVAPPVPTNPVWRFTWEEMQRRRAQNLCFNCNDRFTIGHKCWEPRILMLEGYDGSNTLLCDNDSEEQPVQENYEATTEPEITLHALTGCTAPKTMRIAARIDSHMSSHSSTVDQLTTSLTKDWPTRCDYQWCQPQLSRWR